jgi:hypothetical protein
MKTRSDQSRSGSTLAVVIIIMATLMVIVGIASTYTMNINRNVQRSNTLTNAMTVGDSCIEILFDNWRSICRTGPTQALKTSAFSAIPTPTPTQFPNLPSVAKFIKRGSKVDPADDSEYNSTYTISNYKVIAVGPEWNALADANTTPPPMLGQLAAGQQVDVVTPTTSAVYNYVASADVTLPSLGPSGRVVARVRRVFQKQQLSPWNWAIYYVDPLEIHPGPQFTVTGWVHTNSDLYTAHNSLSFADKVTYAGAWYVGFMPGDQQHIGDIPTAPHHLSNLPPARDQALQPFGLDSSAIFNSGDPNPNNDSYAELIQPPVAGYADSLANQRYWNQAGVVIQVTDNPNPAQPGFDGVNGHDLVTIGVPKSDGSITPLPIASSLYQMFSGAITTNETIQDNREAASMGLASLDVSKILQTGSNPPAYKSGLFNGIVYMYDKSNTSSTRRGIRLKNGSNIPTKGFTAVSNNPIYIQGDFNTGGAPPSDGNPSDPTTPQASGYTRAPTSILADAVNILSNSWNDANSFAGTSSRVATNTTVNAAIVSGIVSTAAAGGDGSYSGGAENFPRFLEDWSSASLTYYGSMVELYKSQQSTGEWGKANVYVPPTRQWYFDRNFKTTPPPGSLMVYSYIKGRWYVL